jgi:glutamate-1-semialdehyde 2,1-aminomutase
MGVVPATQPFVEYLRKATKEIGSLLIFDEVITGFRVGKKGAQGFYGICPDLTCFGKIVGGGFPSAAFGGRREIMDYLAPDGPVYQAGTLAGNPVAMEAGLQGLMLLDSDQFYEKLAAKTERLVGPLKERIKEKGWNACVQQAGSMFTIFFGRRNVNNFDEALMADGELFAQFFRFLFSKGVYISPLQQEACFVSSAHTDENIDKTADLMIQFMDSHCYS